jgi:gas vesicle protein
MEKGKIIVGVLGGVALGALLGVLFAPDKGSITRRNISKKGEEYLDDIKDKFDDFLDNVSEKYSEVKDMVTNQNSH